MREFDRVTTRGGDAGMSSLFNGERYPKDDLIFHAVGTIDELVSVLGVCRSMTKKRKTTRHILEIQKLLFHIGAEIATPEHSEQYNDITHPQESDLERLERWQADLMEGTSIPPAFIVPGDHPLSAQMDVARTVTRRAERHLVTLVRTRGARRLIPSQQILNRLSDFLFVLARAVEQEKA